MTEEAKTESPQKQPESKEKEKAPEAAKPPATAAPKGPRPMARIAARVAFYLGVLSMVSGLAVKYVAHGNCPVGPRAFAVGAVLWFLVGITILLAEIERKIGEK